MKVNDKVKYTLEDGMGKEYEGTIEKIFKHTRPKLYGDRIPTIWYTYQIVDKISGLTFIVQIDKIIRILK